MKYKAVYIYNQAKDHQPLDDYPTSGPSCSKDD